MQVEKNENEIHNAWQPSGGLHSCCGSCGLRRSQCRPLLFGFDLIRFGLEVFLNICLFLVYKRNVPQEENKTTGWVGVVINKRQLYSL